MLHSNKLKIRNKILNMKYEISKGMYRSSFEILMESYELRRCLEFVLHVFDETQKIETANLEHLNIKIIRKEYNNILRTLKLLKIKYKLK